ncbi:MAG TPA: Rrf2 family transcriptional regulator [Paucimonas sp.]|nr:Rrf2 family transcriptional regulator [Paucimonas sp.]
MLPVNDYLFGNLALHDQWRGATQVLVALAERSPQPVRLERLCEDTGRPTRNILKLCGGLARAGLVQEVSRKRREWTLACDANMLTLEDIYLCVLDDGNRRAAADLAATETPDKALRRIDLLLSQATMTVHQSVLTHLRQFSIGTLRRRESSARPRWEHFESRAAF